MNILLIHLNTIWGKKKIKHINIPVYQQKEKKKEN